MIIYWLIGLLVASLLVLWTIRIAKAFHIRANEGDWQIVIVCGVGGAVLIGGMVYLSVQ